MHSSQVDYCPPNSWLVLDVICNTESIRISDLAEKQGMDRTTLTRNLSVLERQGYIKYLIGQTDHRTRIITATHKGRSAVAKAITSLERRSTQGETRNG